MRRAAAAAGEVLVWWGLLVGVWVLTLSSVSGPELVAAAVGGLLCAVAGAVARRAVRGHWRPDPGWVRWLPTLVAALGADSVRVFVAAARHARRRRVPGTVLLVPLHDPRTGDRPAHLALATIAVSTTPGTVVLDTDEATHRLTVHKITSGGPDLEGTVTR